MEAISVLDIFKIGVGPSSSHTMGPWRAAERFLASCRSRGVFERIDRVRVDLFGSLAKTGVGHGTDLAVLMGLAGLDPVTCDTDAIHPKAEAIRSKGRIDLGGERVLPFDPVADITFHRKEALPSHANGLRFTAELNDESAVVETYYSVGGGFVVREGEEAGGDDARRLPLPFETADDLARHCEDGGGRSIPEVVRANERAWRTDEETDAALLRIWEVMKASVWRGCHAEGVLPGGLEVTRRAGAMNRRLLDDDQSRDPDAWIAAIRESRRGFDRELRWVSAFALTVNEENAAFGRVVTAPTNGAAGVIPSVLMDYTCFRGGDDRGVIDFLLTAGAVGILFKKGATLSAAMGGCQAEIGVSSAMAAAGLCQVLGGTPGRALMAAEIAMEHHLGMTCDPVGGLVQVPCIERNVMGAAKAITACQLALEGDPGRAKVPLDAAIRSMWATAQDMNTKYKETSEGGLALQVPVRIAEC